MVVSFSKYVLFYLKNQFNNRIYLYDFDTKFALLRRKFFAKILSQHFRTFSTKISPLRGFGLKFLNISTKIPPLRGFGYEFYIASPQIFRQNFISTFPYIFYQNIAPTGLWIQISLQLYHQNIAHYWALDMNFALLRRKFFAKIYYISSAAFTKI